MALTLHGLLYGVARFANGFLADRANARTFMAVGLAASALMNVFFGSGSVVVTLGVVWMLNGWVQGMGFSPISHLLTHWFPPKELATKDWAFGIEVWDSSLASSQNSSTSASSKGYRQCGHLASLRAMLESLKR